MKKGSLISVVILLISIVAFMVMTNDARDLSLESEEQIITETKTRENPIPESRPEINSVSFELDNFLDLYDSEVDVGKYYDRIGEIHSEQLILALGEVRYFREWAEIVKLIALNEDPEVASKILQEFIKYDGNLDSLTEPEKAATYLQKVGTLVYLGFTNTDADFALLTNLSEGTETLPWAENVPFGSHIDDETHLDGVIQGRAVKGLSISGRDGVYQKLKSRYEYLKGKQIPFGESEGATHDELVDDMLYGYVVDGLATMDYVDAYSIEQLKRRTLSPRLFAEELRKFAIPYIQD